LFSSDITAGNYALIGRQEYQYNFNESMSNLKSMRELLEHSDYINVLEWDTLTDLGVDLGDWSNGILATAQGSMPTSLNLKGVV
jgi:hypothetical protein